MHSRESENVSFSPRLQPDIIQEPFDQIPSRVFTSWKKRISRQEEETRLGRRITIQDCQVDRETEMRQETELEGDGLGGKGRKGSGERSTGGEGEWKLSSSHTQELLCH